MHRPLSTSEKFVDAVYRRLVFYRAVEKLGLGMLVAALLAIVLNLLAIWQSTPTLSIFCVSTILGLLFGAGLTVYRWPTRRSAVIEADRQLGFDDLLTSAIYSSNPTADDFSQVVRAMADARCQLHSPTDVFLRRLDLRTWGGIGVTMGVAVTLAVIPFGAQRSQAINVNSAVLTENPIVTVKSKPSSLTNNPISEGTWNERDLTRDSTLADGSGRGLSTSKNPIDQSMRDNPAAGSKNESGFSATGGMASMNEDQRGDKPTGAQAGFGRDSNSVTPWNGGSPTANPASIVPSNDSVAPEDRDLIRDFFDGR